MEQLKEVWMSIENTSLITIIELFGSILAIVSFFKKPQTIIRISVKKTKKVIFPTAEDWLERGQKAFNKKKFDKAIKCFTKALRAQATASICCSAYCYLGLAYKDKPQNNYDKAVEYFEEALKLCMDDNSKAMIYSNLGFTYTGKKQFTEAINFFNKALALDNLDNAEVKKTAIFALGVLNSDINNYPEAIKYLTQFTKLNNHPEDPQTVRAFYVLGKVYFNTEKFDNTQECFQKVLDFKINEATIFFEMGWRYGAKPIENYEKAIECFQEAKKLGYDTNTIHLYLGIAYLNIDTEDTYKIAKKYFEKITDITPDPTSVNIANVYTNLGLAYYIIDEYDKSLEYSQKAIDCGEKSATLYCNMGFAYEGKGCCESYIFYDAAIANFTKAIELEKDYALAYYGLGLVFTRGSLLNTKRTAIGIKYIQHAAKLGLRQAQKFLDDNKKLISDASKISIDTNDEIFPYVLY